MLHTISKPKSLVFILFFIPVLLIGTFEVTFGQVRTVKGTVTDESGNPVEGAAVEIQRLDVKRNYKTKTDKRGTYIYTGLSFGEYRIVIRKQGFASDFAQGLRPQIGEDNVYDFVLKRGEAGKMAFEYSEAELDKLREDIEKQKEAREQSSEVKALFSQGLEFANQGNFDQAITTYQQALEKDPEQPNIWANMADAQAKSGKNEDAIASFEKAIALRPTDAGFHQNLGVLYGKMGREEDAQASFKKAAELNPAGSAVNFFNLGATLVNSGNGAEAVNAFKQAIEADPNYAEAYYELGICYVGQGMLKEAVDTLKKYVTIGQNTDHITTAKALIEQLGGS